MVVRRPSTNLVFWNCLLGVVRVSRTTVSLPYSLYFVISKAKTGRIAHPEKLACFPIQREGQQSFFAFIPSKDVLGLYGSLDAKRHGVQKIPADSKDSIDLLKLFRYSFVQIQKPFRGVISVLENNTTQPAFKKIGLKCFSTPLQRACERSVFRFC